MSVVNFLPSEDSASQEVTLEDNETLLDALLRSGFDVPFGCKGGVCQSCLMQSDSDIPKAAQQGLKSSQVERGLFLACCCRPEEGFQAQLPNMASELIEAKVLGKKALNDSIFELRLEKVTSYRSGQFVTLWNSDNVARSYSLASHPLNDDFLAFHIKRVENGAFSEWAWNNLNEGDSLRIQGPLGDCFYTGVELSQPLFLAGIGTGLAPLYGIVRDALDQGHNGDIHLYIASKHSDGFYLVEELAQLAKQHANLHVTYVAQEAGDGVGNSSVIEGNIYEEVKKAIPDFSGMRVFLCGADSFVKKMKRQCFLAGAGMRDISADPFIPFAGK